MKRSHGGKSPSRPRKYNSTGGSHGPGHRRLSPHLPPCGPSPCHLESPGSRSPDGRAPGLGTSRARAGDPPQSSILRPYNSTATPSSLPRTGHRDNGGQGKQPEGLLEEAQVLQALKDRQTQPEAQPELRGSHHWVSRAAGSTLPNPSPQPPALPARPSWGQLIPPMSGQRGSGLYAGPRRACRLQGLGHGQPAGRLFFSP